MQQVQINLEIRDTRIAVSESQDKIALTRLLIKTIIQNRETTSHSQNNSQAHLKDKQSNGKENEHLQFISFKPVIIKR